MNWLPRITSRANSPDKGSREWDKRINDAEHQSARDSLASLVGNPLSGCNYTYAGPIGWARIGRDGDGAVSGEVGAAVGQQRLGEHSRFRRIIERDTDATGHPPAEPWNGATQHIPSRRLDSSPRFTASAHHDRSPTPRSHDRPRQHAMDHHQGAHHDFCL